jgi:beta-lactamase regulating signal transducer with metallopeptidase domain/Leucine-rich repeat (LRR) protein
MASWLLGETVAAATLRWSAIPLDATLKATCLLILACGTVWALRRASAAARHLIWFGALAGCLVLPLLSAALPGWQVLPHAFELGLSPLVTDAQRTTAADSPPPDDVVAKDLADPSNRRIKSEQPGQSRSQADSLPAARALDDAPHEVEPELANSGRLLWRGEFWIALALIIWAIGVAAFFLRMGLAYVSLFWLARRCQPLDEGRWACLLSELCAELGIGRRVLLLRGHDSAMPMTWGILRPKLLVPAQAETWSAERCRLVLLHELAHVKRRDHLTHLLAQAAGALYWFHPLAWLALGRLELEREQACDDWVVLLSGSKASEYAEQLVDISTTMVPIWRTQGTAIAMARRSGLESRVRAILDLARNRGALRPIAVIGALAGFAIMATVLASVRPAAQAETPAPAAPVAKEPTAKSDPKQDDDEVLLHFPKDRSLGIIAGHLPNEDTLRTLEATGDVYFARKPHRMLWVNQLACQALSQFKPLIQEGLVGLRFANIRFEPAMIEELASLSGLESLDFTSCNLTDHDLQKLSRLTSLRELYLAQVPITDEGIASLEPLHNLETLHLYFTKVTDGAWQTIAKFNSLKNLRMGDKSITDAGFVHFKELPHLENLSFDELRAISDDAMSQLVTLSQLKWLSLRGQNIKISDAAVAELSQLASLEGLDLINTTISDKGMAKLDPMKSLKRLTLPSSITDQGLSRIGEFTSLTSLQYYGDRLTDEAIEKIALLPQLERLGLAGEGITDRGMTRLAKITTLKELEVRDSSVGDEGLAALAALPSLDYLSIHSSKITSDGLRHLQHFPALTKLEFEMTEGDTSGLQHLRPLTRLEFLHIGSNSRWDEKRAKVDLGPLAGLTNLKTLDLGFLPIDDAAVKQIAELPSIEKLYLDMQNCTRLTDEALASLARTPKLSVLFIGGRFTDRGAESLTASPSLRQLIIISYTLSDAAISKLRKTMSVQGPNNRNVESTAKFFNERGEIGAELALAKAEARREHTRVLLVVGDAQSALSNKLVQVFDQEEVSDAAGSYERVSVTPDDFEKLSELVSVSVADLEALKLPALVMVDDNGHVLLDQKFVLQGNESFVDPQAIIEFVLKHAPKLDAEAMLAAAFEHARRENKRVFLKHTGAYCGPCRTMSKFWEDHAAFFDSEYVPVTIDSTRFTNGRAVMHRYRPKFGLIPWVAILDADGKTLVTSDSPAGPVGFPSDGPGVGYFMHMLSQTVQRATPEQLKAIRTALEQQLAKR